VDDAGPVHGVSGTQNYTDNVCDEPQVEGDDFVTQQICICVSLFLPSLPYRRPVYSAPWLHLQQDRTAGQLILRKFVRSRRVPGSPFAVCCVHPDSTLIVLSLSVEQYIPDYTVCLACWGK
jgi:hypothetical protein